MGGQYRTLITKMVNAFTDEGIVVILDLHNNDDTDNQHLIMSKKDPNIGGIPFWQSVSYRFKYNSHVFYELYNEPHVDDDQFDMFINGDDSYDGMLELEAAVRGNAPDAVLIIAGAMQWAYNS